MLRPVVWLKFTDVSEVLPAAIFRAMITTALMMEAASTSETSVNFYQSKRHNIPQDSHLHARRRENLKSYKGSHSLYSSLY
jgi:hypothetical protein